MSEEEKNIKELLTFVEKEKERIKEEEDKFNKLMEQIFELSPDLVLMKLDLAFRLHRETILLNAEYDGREKEVKEIIRESSLMVDNIMKETKNYLRNEIIKRKRRRKADNGDGDTRTMGPDTGYS